MPIHYVCKSKLNRLVESERSAPQLSSNCNHTYCELWRWRRSLAPPLTILLSSILSRASFRLRLLGGEIGFVLFIYPQSTRELRALICISKGRGETGEGVGEVEEFDRGSQIGKSSKYCLPGRGSSSTFLFIRVKQIKVVAADRRNGSNMLNRTKIYMYIYMHTYI